ncbi:MAG: MAPEG family protein [Bosea sp. (in: a-proteobacteria)]|uniref:MAPEG family protein n=1 Tax=Bosea sp. (in: a-proteobacteria) TaxID=1871050 RepID=UPI00273716E8|nr:MAPEG family protein [Bosea sp. (in: a-proteobacteria)]MDP3255728.1 MAPEG family protein [Bosea sp. (in: a-proteobacteria)]MDP3319828.1 MAPEG family protein [Bosea sp. (in: a-proteobacteria)]
MPLVIVPVYAALLALLFVMLSLSVVRQRRSGRIAIGTAGDRDLERRVRVHGNFAEYTPLALLLLAMAEFRGAPSLLLHALCLCLLVGRASHAWGVSHLDEDLRFRVAGMVATFLSLIVAAVTLLVQALVG